MNQTHCLCNTTSKKFETRITRQSELFAKCCLAGRAHRGLHLTRCLRCCARGCKAAKFSATQWPRAARAKGPGQGKLLNVQKWAATSVVKRKLSKLNFACTTRALRRPVRISSRALMRASQENTNFFKKTQIFIYSI